MSNSNSQLPIGLFDSGVGGLTVLQEITQLLPHEHCVYYGDTARFPYGNRTPGDILKLAKENAGFLLAKKIKLLAIPCYTASTHGAFFLQKHLSIPVIGITQLGVRELAYTTKTKTVAILGTTSTIESGFLQTELLSLNPFLKIHAIPCPLFAPFVEEGFPSHPALKKIAKHYLAPLEKTNVDAVLLACTHYPFLSTTIQEILGNHVQLISPAPLFAQQIKDVLHQKKIDNPLKDAPTYRFYVSARPKKFRTLAEGFLKLSIEKIKLAQNKTL